LILGAILKFDAWQHFFYFFFSSKSLRKCL
jgi:hypothetical protein